MFVIILLARAWCYLGDRRWCLLPLSCSMLSLRRPDDGQGVPASTVYSVPGSTSRTINYYCTTLALFILSSDNVQGIIHPE